MQPKPIEARHLLDIDTRNRLVEYEGIPHLRGVREHREHPAETDYDVVQEEARRNREEAARRSADELNKARRERTRKSNEPAEETLPNEGNQADSAKGSHLDIEA